ncbi:MAG TPA: hypothetical protein VLA12_05785, partial [Planctomycetaceae bacterium]|nr:hypothetical protein [Planctomycetaceae bacterium]
PPEEILPITQAIARVFGRHGEKKIRSRARLKFLIEKWGMEKFKAEVLAERATLTEDPRWTDYLDGIEDRTEQPLKPPGEMPQLNGDPQFNHWCRTNLREQKQDGYVTATITLPLGDITPDQLRSLADISRKYTRGTVRATVEQNLVLRWISKSDVKSLYSDLAAVRLAEPGASNIYDIVACPGTDTCKLGISSSRGLAAELRDRLIAKGVQLDQAIQNMHIKISGCFNSCGQHHVCDIGFYGVSRTMGGFKVPHFQVVLGGQWEENAASYGMPIAAVPSKRVPEALERITEFYLKQRQGDERFPKFVTRIGKGKIRELLDPLTENAPAHEVEPEFYSDWSDPRQYSIGDIGKGECAGEVVSQYEFQMVACDRFLFGAQIALEEGRAEQAGKDALTAMLKAAKALVQIQYDDVTEDDPQEIIDEFKERYYDTERFFDPFAGSKFADYLFAAWDNRDSVHNAESARTLIEEAQLFSEAVHACYNRIRTEGIGEKAEA